MLTPTQEQAIQRHKAFHRQIAERAAKFERREPVQKTSRPPVHVEINEIAEDETGVQITKYQSQVVIVTDRKAIQGWPAFQEIGTPRITVEKIIGAVLKEFPKISLLDIKSERRTDQIVKPRQIAMYLAKTLTPRTLPDIGRRFGGRDHTTVLHAVRKIGRLIETDQIFAAQIEKIKTSLEAS